MVECFAKIKRLTIQGKINRLMVGHMGAKNHLALKNESSFFKLIFSLEKKDCRVGMSFAVTICLEWEMTVFTTSISA